MPGPFSLTIQPRKQKALGTRLDRTLYLKSVLGTAEQSGKFIFCYPVCWAS
jgi:hypothetical protein